LHWTTAQDALTVQLEYLIIKQVKNESNPGLTQITLWVSGLSGSVMLTRLQHCYHCLSYNSRISTLIS